MPEEAVSSSVIHLEHVLSSIESKFPELVFALGLPQMITSQFFLLHNVMYLTTTVRLHFTSAHHYPARLHISDAYPDAEVGWSLAL